MCPSCGDRALTSQHRQARGHSPEGADWECRWREGAQHRDPGLVITGAALAVKDRPVAIIDLGMIACGFGEWFNHRQEMDIFRGGSLSTCGAGKDGAGLFAWKPLKL